MYRSGTANKICSILFLCAAFLLCTCAGALAAENGGDPGWRPVYDTIMLWVNFGILVFLLYRYGRQPFMNFIKNQSAQVSEDITRAENRKDQIQKQIDDTRKQMQESGERYEQIKQRIIEEGRRQRQSIIDDAREQAKQMLERERRNTRRRMLEARNRLMAELADIATDQARKRLPEEITAEDQSRLIEFYLENVNSMQPQA